MANKIMITGYSGTGKTFAARTLDPLTTFIICPDEKALPFKGWKKNYVDKDPVSGIFSPTNCNFLKTTSWNKIQTALNFVSQKRPDINVVLLDTITYAMIGEFMEKAKTVGYTKFTEMGDNVYKTLKMIDGLRDDLTVIVMAHTEVKSFNGVDKTVFAVPGGKLVQDVVKPEGMFATILETVVEKKGNDIEYGFMTQNNTTNMAKSPHGLFASAVVPNDLKAVLAAIKAFEE